MLKTLRLAALLLIPLGSGAYACPDVRSFDGSMNNCADGRALAGSAGSKLLRLGPAEYLDGASATDPLRPSARLVSATLASAGGAGISNARALSSFVFQWGQFLDHDLDLTPAGGAPLPIAVPAGDAYFDPHGLGNRAIAFTRSVFDPDTGTSGPRQQLNEITTWIDGSMLYGSSATRAGALRASSNGEMRMTTDGLLIKNTAGLPNDINGGDATAFFLSGDLRANEQIGLTAMHTLFSRENNRVAALFRARSPGLDDEAIFQAARRFVGAEIQQITYAEFLPALIGPQNYEQTIGDWSGYDPGADPSIANEFSTAAFRFGHTALPAELMVVDEDTLQTSSSIALRDAFFNPAFIDTHGIDGLLRGLYAQRIREIDTVLVDDVVNFLFGPPGSTGLDLASLNIQRGRDHGIPYYNDLRAALNLERAENFADITGDPTLQILLAGLYGDVDSIDAWVGGLAEDHFGDGSLGELFTEIIADQFVRLRSADRFWFENDAFFAGNGLADGPTLADEIIGRTLYDILIDNTGIAALPGLTPGASVFFTPFDLASTPLPLGPGLTYLGAGIIVLLGRTGRGGRITARRAVA